MSKTTNAKPNRKREVTKQFYLSADEAYKLSKVRFLGEFRSESDVIREGINRMYDEFMAKKE